MCGPRRVRAAGAAGALCALLAACGGGGPGAITGASGVPPAGTGSRLQSIMQENNLLLYTPPQEQYQTLARIKSLGVDVVKVALIWSLVSPDSSASSPPQFNATNPNAYPGGAWTRYDHLVEAAHQLGLRIYFQIIPPIPKWAIAPGLPRGQGEVLGQAPSFRPFEQFVEAVGRRYSGSFRDGNGRLIPRVSEWGIWNEPNWRNWLNPISLSTGGVKQTSQPMLYRGLVDAAWEGLAATGHRSDTLLVGETANVGTVTPIKFAEDLYCVGPSYQPLTGTAAAMVGCPTSGERSAFVAKNHGLFAISGYAHHPYDFDIPPDQRSKVSTQVALANIGQLEQALNGIFAGYGKNRPGGIPIYASEWGYVTNPPNPEYHTSLQEQAMWLNEGEYMMWRQPFVKALSQFLLVDVAPLTSKPTKAEWLHVFATGLIFSDGKPKPALAAYRLPIWLPDARTGTQVPMWAQLRPANHSSTQVGEIEFQPHGLGSWRRLRSVTTTSPEGFIWTHATIPSAGLVRLAWRSPAGAVFYSRSASVR